MKNMSNNEIAFWSQGGDVPLVYSAVEQMRDLEAIMHDEASGPSVGFVEVGVRGVISVVQDSKSRDELTTMLDRILAGERVTKEME